MKNSGLIPLRALAAAIALAAVLSAGATGAEKCASCDDVWLISTRHIAEIPCQHIPEQLHIERLEGGCFRRRSFEEFLATSDPAQVTIFYVHGNRYTPEDAIERGRLVHQRLQHGRGPYIPIRFVIWSWPSERVIGPVNDVRTKAERTDLEGLYLGTVLAYMPPNAPTSLIGFSFGTRIISGALHLLGGCPLEGRVLPPELLLPRMPVRAVLMAPAFHNTWLLPGAFHSCALWAVDRMLVLYNPLDPVLRWYQIISPTRDPQALGYTGLVGLERLGPLARRIEQVNVAQEVGRTHDELEYLYSSFFPDVREYALWRTWR